MSIEIVSEGNYEISVELQPDYNIAVNPSGVFGIELNGMQGFPGAPGAQGDPGPNQVTTTTATNITGILKGNGSTVQQAVAGTDYGTVSSVGFTAGAGIGISGTNPITGSGNVTFTNTAPDQVVIVNAGTGISVTGTYPNFTVSNTQTSAQWGNITGTLSSQTDLQNALNAKENTANKGVNNGYAGLDGSGKVPSTQLPSYVDDVLEYANYAALPVTGETGKIYITLDTNYVYRWSGSVYVQISQPNAVWGSITGTLSNQTDLQNALNAKQDTLVSGTNIKTVNSNSLLGSGNVSVGTVTSVGLTMPSAFSVANSPVTGSGTLAVTGAGSTSQYVRGDGALANFPAAVGGGSSVSYYLNGSVNQGTFGGNTYYEMNRTPVIGSGTNFTLAADGYIAQFITDAGDPSLLNIPAGNWDFQMYFSVSSTGGSPRFYTELYKYNGSSFTLIASGSTSPQNITGGTFADVYTSTLAVPATSLTLTDRLAIRVYVLHSGRTITLYTEDNKLAEIHTTFSTGLAALNGLTAQVQYLGVGTSGTDFNIASATDTHTFNLPTASATNRGALSSTDWSTFNSKQAALVSGTNIKTLEGQSLLGSGNIDLGKSDVGLSNVDNTSDANKPISTATQSALDNKQATLVSGTNIKTLEGQSLLGSGNIDLGKSDVGLGNVDNTSDLNKPVSTATQAAINRKTVGNNLYLFNNY